MNDRIAQIAERRHGLVCAIRPRRLERKMPHFASNKYCLVAENSYWCFPRNQQRAVTPKRPSVQARTRAIAPR